jgi:hypothetical protein
MGYSLACPICEERVHGREFRDTDLQLIVHMNAEHPVMKRRKSRPDGVVSVQQLTEILPDLDIEGLEEPW